MNSDTDGGLGNILLPDDARLAQEAQQFRVYFLRVCPRDAMRTVLHHHLACSFDELCGAPSRSCDGQDAVGIPLDHQGRHIDAGQVLAEVFMPGWDAREAGDCGGTRRDVPAGLDGLFADTLSQQYICVVEILEETGKESTPVSCYRLLYPGKYAAIHPLRVVGRFEQVRRHSGDDHRFAHTTGTVFPQVSRHFASSHGEADQGEIVQLQLRDQFMKVLGEGVVVVARGWLAGLAEASSVVGDDPVTSLQQDGKLFLPRSATQWVSVDQDNGLPRAVVFVVKLDVARIFFSDSNVRHFESPFCLLLCVSKSTRLYARLSQTRRAKSIR